MGLCQELVPTGKSQLRPPGHLITASNLTALRGLTAADQTGTLHVLCRAQFQHSRPSSFQFLSVPLGDQDPPGLSEDAPPPSWASLSLCCPRPAVCTQASPGSSRMKKALTHKCPLRASESSLSKLLSWNLFCCPQLSVSNREAQGWGWGVVAAVERHFPGNSSRVQLAHTWIRFGLNILCQGK